MRHIEFGLKNTERNCCLDSFSFKEKLEQFKIPIGLSILGLVLIIGGVITSGISKAKPTQKQDFPKESLIDSQRVISVDVSGAVKKAGVYQLKEGSRIEDAITSAGGFAEDSNSEYIAKYLNMAQKLVDGSKVYVPFIGEEGVSAQGGAALGASTQAKVNINTAGQVEIESLPGIGPVTASKIISDRPYQKIEDLLDKKVISKAVFEKVKDQIVVY